MGRVKERMMDREGEDFYPEMSDIDFIYFGLLRSIKINLADFIPRNAITDMIFAKC